MLGKPPFHKRHPDEAIPVTRGNSGFKMGGKHRCLEYGCHGEFIHSRLGIQLQSCIRILTIPCHLQVFELITGDYLFDPQSGTKYGKDDDHIAQIIELMGPFPKSLCLSGKWSQEIFNRKGELRNIHRLRHWALPDVLKEKYHFKEEEARRIADFLCPMLELVPEKRANAGGMAGHIWLEDTAGMKGVKIEGLEVGSRGEGIDGWANEIRRR